MNTNEIPTPEMDGLEINVPNTRVNAIMALNAVIGKGRHLERRLTVAREALQAVSDAGGNYCDLLTSQEIAEKALGKSSIRISIERTSKSIRGRK